MEAFSFSLPAGGEACPMSLYEDDALGRKAICSGCYAQIGRYGMDNVLSAQWIRYLWLKEKLASEAGTTEFVDLMVRAIQKDCSNRYFRWMDSGDLFSPAFVDAITAIVRRTPRVYHWIPTRSWRVFENAWATPTVNMLDVASPAKWRDSFLALLKLPNIAVRPSALHVGAPAPEVLPFSAGSGVAESSQRDLPGPGTLCPKSVNGGSCESNGCRSCWDKNGGAIYYLVHGWQGRKTLADVNAGKLPARRAAIKNKFTALTVGGRA